jgi:hypothetical protein
MPQHFSGDGMIIKRVAVGDMFGWLGKTFSLVLAHPGAMCGAAILMLLAALAMSLPTFFVIGSMMTLTPGVPPDVEQFWLRILIAYNLVLLLNLVLMPPLVIGWMRMVRDLEQGRPAGALSIFRPFADRPVWISGIGLALLTLLAVVVLVAVLLALFWIPGSAFFAHVAELKAAQAAGLDAPAIIAAYLLFGMFGVLIQFACMLGLVELALRGGGAVQALTGALKAVARNALGLWIWTLVVGITAFVFIVIIGVVVGMLIVAVAAAAPSAATFVGMLLYVPMALIMYPLMHAGCYVAWKDMLGSDAAADTGQEDGEMAA